MSSLTSPGLKTTADKTIIALRPYLEKLTGCALDFSADFLGRTKYVSVGVVAGSAETFNASSANYGHSTGTLKYVDVSCSTHKKCTFDLTDVDCLEVEDSPLWSQFAKASAEKVGPEIVKAAMALLTYGDREAKKTLSAVTVAGVCGLAGAVMDAGYNPEMCTLYLKPATFFTLVGLLPNSVLGSADVLKTGRINGALFGFGSVQASPNISTYDAEATQYGLGFVVPDGAIAVAARIPKPPKGGEGYVEIGEHRDEVTGFSLGLRVHVNPDKGSTFLNVESLFGARLTKDGSNGAPGYIQVVSQ